MSILAGVLVSGCVNRQALLEEIKSELPLQGPGPSPQAHLPVDKKTGPLLRANREELLDRMRLSWVNLQSIRSQGRITFLNRSAAGAQESQVEILYDKPRRFFVKGRKELMPDFFTLATDGDTFWFHVPHYNTVYTGTLDRLGLSHGFELLLDPVLLERSLLPAPAAVNEAVQLEEAGNYYVLSFYRTEGGLKMLQRKWWVERHDLWVEKEIYYSAQGIPELEFIRKDYLGDRFLSFPREVEFRKIAEGKMVRIVFEKPLLNQSVPYDRFKYEPPVGVVIEKVN